MTEGVSPDEASRSGLDSFRARHAAGGIGAEFRAGFPARVERLDLPGQFYFLVPISDASGLTGIVQVDGQTGRVETSARILDPSLNFVLPQAMALDVARRLLPHVQDWGTPQLGWLPCKESFDGMRPFWVLRHANGLIYVDQAGRGFESLTLSGRGG